MKPEVSKPTSHRLAPLQQAPAEAAPSYLAGLVSMKGFALAAIAIVKVAAVDTTEGAYENGWVKYEHETVAGKTLPDCSGLPSAPDFPAAAQMSTR